MTMGTSLYVLVVYITLVTINFKNVWGQAGCNLLTSEEKDACFVKGVTHSDDSSDVSWMEKCVGKYFCLQPQPGQKPKDFKKPQFENELKTFRPGDYFEYAAKRIEKFFLRNPDWKTTKSNQNYRGNGCVKLLAITDARYLYVTYVLFIQSGKTLTACQQDSNKKYILPAGVCFPRPYGSGTCTSDYDVGLIGHTSGILTIEFNAYFSKTFKKPSEELFDTNVYAYTLEYAMPEMFTGMTGFFKNIVPYLGLKPWYQMQELASAYFKMYKFKKAFYEEFKVYALANLGGLGPIKSVPDRNLYFRRSIQNLENWDRTKKAINNINDLRNEHNKIYEQKMIEAQKHFDTRKNYQEIVRYMSEMSLALVYAAEAYHTRGAIRHVVGDLQMRLPIVKATTIVQDYWVSMIENWADCNKEYEHCTGLNVEACLLKMSKYLRRTFHAMKSIYNILSRIPNPGNALKATNLLPPMYPFQPDPEQIALKWVLIFRGKREEIPEFNTNVKPFLDTVGCSGQREKAPLDFDCMKSIQAKVMSYNNILVSATAKDSAAIQAIFILMPNGQQKTAPP